MVNWILGDKFYQRYPHLDGVKALWETKWKFPCSLGVYPFHDGKLEDFEPIFESLIKDNVNDAYTDKYTEYFFPVAEKLTDAAMSAQGSDRLTAAALFKRAACVYRISRYPSLDAGSGVKRKAFELQKQVYLRGASLWDAPMKEVKIPHTAAEGADGKEISLFVRLPKGASSERKCPVVLLITGLDGHRPDNSERTDEFLARGWGCVITEIPGTADCPADRRDPTSHKRLFTAILDWMDKQPYFDMRKCMAWGLSAGGYCANRLAHTHHSRLAGVVAQGAGSHHFLSREWLERVDDHEYPFILSEAYVAKYGYKDWEEMKEKAQGDYSLVTNGIVNRPSCRLLLVNGTLDGLVPIEDSMLLMNYGKPKEARFYENMLHMGYPPANESIWPWMESVMATASSA
ncbi:pigment biosynthesis protein Ayg1 [Cladophialophora carrionii]|uniref:Pigment biosynthesis protein Ayg1 n=1 Tax=Cladophialophora carrionii TaxID=86049 RepID=A0A1C1D0Z4_9EURO|nr:pigment biosynthesis protein Ayg1 [Cladophialophora carrionii]